MHYSTSAAGRKLIADFEGCELSAYVCPAGVLTIGFGHTGSDVKVGDTITTEEAYDLLSEDLQRFENVVNVNTTVGINQSMFDALVSFTYNCGGDAFKNSTLLRLLNNGDYEGAAGQFDRWVKGPNGPLAGLVRRRDAEEAMFRSMGFPNGASTEAPVIIETIKASCDTILKKEPIQGSELHDNQKSSVNAGKEYKIVWKGKPADNHVKVSLAYGAGNWFIYTPHWEGAEETGTVEVEESSPTGDRLLGTPYFSQRDNYRDANRTCFSSSCAMLVETLKPGSLPGERGDDKYVQTVFSIGDTTEAWVQLKALAEYGVEAEFIQNGNIQTIKDQIDKGIPVPVGILHHGPSSAPSGGGHWICIIGYDNKGFFVNDPWGEITHSTGYYDSTNGSHVHYSYNLMNARWTVSHPNDGWAIIAK